MKNLNNKASSAEGVAYVAKPKHGVVKINGETVVGIVVCIKARIDWVRSVEGRIFCIPFHRVEGTVHTYTRVQLLQRKVTNYN